MFSAHAKKNNFADVDRTASASPLCANLHMRSTLEALVESVFHLGLERACPR